MCNWIEKPSPSWLERAPAGQRVAQIIAGPATPNSDATTIRVCSRRIEKAEKICQQLAAATKGNFVPTQTGSAEESLAAISDADAIFACGAAGIELLTESWHDSTSAAVAIDLNAVPPAGISGIGVMDSASELESTICYGAIGVGGLEMKVHRRAIEMLFGSNEQVLEVEQLYQIGKEKFAN